MTIPLEPWVGRLRTVRAAIERRPVTLLFDTGGGETLVTSRVLEGVGCASEGRAVGFRISGERVEWARCRGFPLEVAGTTLLPRTVGVFDVMPLFGDQLPQGTPPVGGVLSLDAARSAAHPRPGLARADPGERLLLPGSDVAHARGSRPDRHWGRQAVPGDARLPHPEACAAARTNAATRGGVRP